MICWFILTLVGSLCFFVMAISAARKRFPSSLVNRPARFQRSVSGFRSGELEADYVEAWHLEGHVLPVYQRVRYRLSDSRFAEIAERVSVRMNSLN